ncbi:EAL and HDOD domain-containing protein [Pectinatus brassicae]|uniref:EAL and modified HD-GYP domain-containing signal transduction protein n=1 Tax=Pectinatus brassicae TaxID=862415 RepID=A0A840UI22_9FIRM|nr:HDOD domain-containing protein [Pectinatus brassicae]MBB5336766.1 EAL and modified HD-GYP domain-containing signal transduction protein [Pectinatus brassicae]
MNVYVARQPILDKNRETVAYELLFRDGTSNYMSGNTDGYTATKNILTNSMVSLGLNTLTNNKKAFINFTGKNIEDGNVQLLSAETSYIEILENTEPTPSLIESCKKLRQKGYKFVLDDFIYDKKYKPLIDLVDIIKIDFLITTNPTERRMMRSIIPSHIKLLAEKIENEEDYYQAVTFGYELFQGYFFCKPLVISRKALPTKELSQLLLLREVNAENIDTKKLENIIKQDISLVHKLLNYINSPGVGLSNSVYNIRQAIVLMGIEKVRNWLNLIFLQKFIENKPNEIFIMSIIRARFCELMAGNMNCSETEKDAAFLVGVLSLSNIVLDESLEQAVIDLGLSDKIKEALFNEKSFLGQLLEIAVIYEKGQWTKVDEWLKKYSFSAVKIAQLYNNALVWANGINTD